jgi:cytochrome o ubiquinol oxidase subunit 2
MATLVILCGCDAVMLNPKGIIAYQERNLIFTALGLMMIVVIPTFILTFVFAWRYRESNKAAKYDPKFTHSTIVEVVCWGVPVIICIILGSIIWRTTHELDPYKPLDSDIKPVTVQVVALNWKWLFIYPEQNIATVNFVEFPVNVPVNFRITSDAPMNSFWIPQLSGQIYAMAGMQTKLHIMATAEGDFNGNGASYSGEGFSGMKFIARVVDKDQFNEWVKQVRQSKNNLTGANYLQLVKSSENNPVEYYGQVRANLYDDIIMQFMVPGVDLTKPHMDDMDMHSMGSM